MSRVTFGTFSLAVPEDWTLSTMILAGPVEAAPDDDPGPFSVREERPFQQNIVMTAEQVLEGVTPEDYVKRQVDGLLQAGVVRYEKTAPARIKLESGREALLLEQVIQGGNGELVGQMQIVSIKDQVAYTVIASQLDGPAYQRARLSFEKILLSLS